MQDYDSFCKKYDQVQCLHYVGLLSDVVRVCLVFAHLDTFSVSSHQVMWHLLQRKKAQVLFKPNISQKKFVKGEVCHFGIPTLYNRNAKIIMTFFCNCDFICRFYILKFWLCHSCNFNPQNFDFLSRNCLYLMIAFVIFVRHNLMPVYILVNWWLICMNLYNLIFMFSICLCPSDSYV